MLTRYSLIIGVWVLFVAGCAAAGAAVSRLDPAFGLNGRVAVELGAKNSAYAVLVQTDGRIVVAGSSGARNGHDFTLLRFNRDGSLDPSFGGEGSVTTPLAKGDDEALALGQLADGRIIAAGYSHNGADRDFALACYLQDGSLDPNFGDGGVTLTAIGNGNEEITALTVDGEDAIIVVGSTEGTFGRVLVAARFLANGDMDPSFGEQGVSLIGVGSDAAAEGVIERRDGSLIISGSYQENNTTAMMLVGLDRSGFLDLNFGTKGVATTGTFAASEGYGLAEDPSGKIYVAGAVGGDGARDAALFRFLPDGQADGEFGDQGARITRVGAGDEVFYDLVLDATGAVASGYVTEGKLRQFLVAAFQGLHPAESAAARDARVTDTVPVEKVWVNGKTRIQLRKLQIPPGADGEMQVRRLRVATAQNDPFAAPSGAATGNPALAASGRQLERFLQSSAAATGNGGTAAPAAQAPAQVIITRFGEGESVSYGLAADAAGNIIAVGTAENSGMRSIAVARYAAEVTDDPIVDQPGHRSSHIATNASADITRTSIAVSGEIAETFGHTVVKRGLVYAIEPLPVFSRDSLAAASPAGEGGDLATAAHGGGPLLPWLVSQLGSFFVSEALAASGPGAPGDRLVLRGETDNGSGPGPFSVVLEHLKPGTVYYVRSYAQTASGAVFYGNQRSYRTADACFIATASYGTLFHPGVGILRQFRDSVLSSSTIGRGLVDLYYGFSPPLADALAPHPVWRAAIRILLLPVVGFSWLTLQVGLPATGACFLMVAGLLAWGCRLRCRRDTETTDSAPA